jgi:hypothetical protein
MACGCVLTVDADQAPECPAHGERRVTRVIAPAPRITAVDCDATGPLVRKA